MTSKTHYTLNHILSYVRNIIAIALICWVAVELENANALWAIILIIGSYQHDFTGEDKSTIK